MGVKNLSKLIRKHAPGAVRTTTLSDYSGKRLAFDTPIFMYKYASIMPGNVVQGFKDLHALLDQHDIVPIFVFDGKTSEAKTGEMNKRRATKKRARVQCAEAEEHLRNVKQKTTCFNFAELVDAQEKYEKASKRVQGVPTSDDYTHVIEWMKSRDIAHMFAPYDAEKLITELVTTKRADMCVTEDFDVLPYYARFDDISNARMLTGMGKSEMTEYNLEQVLKGFNIDQKQLVDVCILSGCDFSEKIHGIAAIRALQLVRAHGTIEEILRVIDRRKYTVPEVFEYKKARDEFLS